VVFARINGINLQYRCEGRAYGRIIVFVNSLGTDFRIWDEVVPALAASARVIRYDLRGHGLSDAMPAQRGIDDHVDDLLALLDHLGAPRATIIGLSVGGMIAQRLAILAPQRVEALVLCCTAAKIGSPEMWADRIKALQNGGLGTIADAVLERWFTKRFREHKKADLEGWRNMLVRTPLEGYVDACAAIRDADFRAEIGAISAPTLCVAGDEDGATPADLVRATAEMIPGALLAIISGAGHLPCIEQAAALAQLIADHLNKTQASKLDVPNDRYSIGMKTRRTVLGDAHVDNANAQTTTLDKDFQTFITEVAWGSVWSRPGWNLRQRSIVTIALLAALGHHDEIAMHIRATKNTGASQEDIKEAMMHVAIYGGVPAANHAIKIIKEAYLGMESEAG